MGRNSGIGGGPGAVDVVEVRWTGERWGDEKLANPGTGELRDRRGWEMGGNFEVQFIWEGW